MRHVLVLLSLLLSLLPTSVAHADAVRASSVCAPLLSLSGVMQGISYQSSDGVDDQWPAAYLSLLNLVLEGIDEMTADALGHDNRLQVKIQLLNKLSSSSIAISPLNGIQTRFSPRLSTLADSGQFEALIENLTDADWATVRQGIEQKLAALQNLQTAQTVARPITQEDFIDVQDLNGEVRLHRIMRQGSIDDILQVIAAPDIPLRYLNTRSKKNLTPLDIFYLRFKSQEPPVYIFYDRYVLKRELFLSKLQKKGARSYKDLLNLDKEVVKAARANQSSRIRELYSQGANIFGILHSAIAHVAIDAFKTLLELGADANNEIAPNPFLTALALRDEYRAQRKEIIQLLLNSGWDPRKVKLASNVTLFALAIEKRQRELYDLFLPFVDNIDALYSGVRSTPISSMHVAAKLGDLETIQYLYEKGADISIRDANDETPLHLAARHIFDEEIAKTAIALFAKSGADLSALNRYGKTPFDCANMAMKKAMESRAKKGGP